MSKTHYRKVFKSDHLGAADLEEMIEEGKSLVFTIREVKQEIGVTVAGKKGDHNIAYFKEGIKPLVVNAKNSKMIRKFTKNSPFIEDWKNIIIELYIDENVKLKGELVGGVRIRPVQPVIKKEKPEFTEANFEKAKEANADLEKVKAIYSVTPEIEAKYLLFYAG